MINIFIPKEILKRETRVAATPETLKKIKDLGVNILVEEGAGEGIGVNDDGFKGCCSEIVKYKKGIESADIVLSVNPPTKKQLNGISENAIWISSLVPQNEIELIKELVLKKITFFSMNLIPRISRAQKMDVLSSQSNIAGYKAVILAASELPKIFPLMMTAAGTIKPAKVVVMGAGVAGLQAIATAKRLGAQVEASDIRPAVKEQVESLGAKFIEVESDEKLEDEKGYAKVASKEFLKKQAEEVAKRVTNADVVITTALIPGRKAPILITEKMVKTMNSGSIIVDLASSQGGNCELTENGKTVEKHGVKIIGIDNIPATVAVHATEMYAKNLLNFLVEIVKNGKVILNMEDECIKESMLTHEGKIVHEPTNDLIGGKK